MTKTKLKRVSREGEQATSRPSISLKQTSIELSIELSIVQHAKIPISGSMKRLMAFSCFLEELLKVVLAIEII